jgi:transmembrane sensor
VSIADTSSQSEPVIDWALLDRYLAGEASEEERAVVDRWLSADESHWDTLGQLSRMVRDTYPYKRSGDPEQAWMAIAARAGIQPAEQNSANKRAQVHRGSWSRAYIGRRSFIGAAALVGAVLCLIAGWYTVAQRDASGIRQSVTEYATAKGQRTTVRLSDGTVVLLNVASRIRVPDQFGKTTRVVYLDGEAQFEVTHRGDIPFVVSAAGTQTTVLGTTFGIRAYEGEGKTRVFVREGKVSVRSTGVTVPQSATLTRGEAAEIIPGRGPDVIVAAHDEQYLGWTQGKLIFDRTPVAQALTELSRWYDIDIVLTDSTLATRRVTGTFDAQSMQSVNGVLTVIAAALDARFIWNGRQVTFLPSKE